MKLFANNNTVVFSLALSVIVILSVTGACGVQTKIEKIKSQEMKAQLALSRNEIEEERKVIAQSKRDTIKVQDDDGTELIIMKAVKDEASGEMVAHEVLDAAVITARFRNVAERHGRIDLRFEVIVPAAMQDRKWQLRFYPDMFIMEDSLRLEPVIITGAEYRRGQLRGYEQYNKFLQSIINDTTAFIDLRNLEIFIKRNLPDLYSFKTDSTYVPDSVFRAFTGVTEQDAIRHYTNRFAKKLNERRKANRSKMYAKYVKVPIVHEGIRLDSVIQNTNEDLVYHYTQTINTRPKLRKVDIVLSGEIYESDQRLYTMAPTEPLTFYISSLSAFVDGTERYMTKVVERRAAANTACFINFKSGRSDLDPSLGNNSEELSRIKGNILDLLQNTKYDLDSIVIAASASPEGALKLNNALSEKRAGSIAGYFDSFIKHYRDSVQRVLNEEARNTFTMVIGDDGSETVGRAKAAKADIPNIKFLSRSNGENWDMLSYLVDQDSVLTPDNVKSYMKYLEIKDLDARDMAMRKESYYKYMKDELFPKLRSVRLDFHLHRRGMIKDTIHTTELDTTYMKGVEALKERDYELALTYLRDYRDYNTAIAYVSLDYNASAMAILQDLEKTPQVNYMLALLYARNGDDEKAVQHYLTACKKERSYVFRGNLDPEIYILIQRYGLNKQDEDEFDY